MTYMNYKSEIHKEFEEIGLNQILQHIKTLTQVELKTNKLEEILKTEYNGSQTIILKGDKKNFKSLIEFWLICQAWYSDGYDTFFKTLIFDDLTLYDGWKSNSNRVGVSKPMEKNDLERLIKRIKYFDENLITKHILEMDTNWNNHKVLFSDGINYFLYFFWTGE